MNAELDDTIVIRPAVVTDVPDIYRLVVHLAQTTGHPRKITSTPDDFLAAGFSEPVAFHALIAERGNEAIGLSIFFYTFSSWRGELGAYVQDLVVVEEARGLGIGKRLMQETAQLAINRGATHLRLSVAADNESATEFYHRIGLLVSDSERIFEASGHVLAQLAADL